MDKIKTSDEHCMFDPLPCPFCGSSDIEEIDASQGIHFMKCNNCKARGPHADWPTGAWNERQDK